MDVNEVKQKYDELNSELKLAVSHMEYTDRVIFIRDAIKDLQRLCNHNNGSFDFSNTSECPYCGKKFRGA